MEKVALIVRLASLLFWFDQSLQSSLERAGFEPVSRMQSLFLLCLASGQNKPSQIADKLGVSRQTISHIINSLSERGLIVLDSDPADARGRIISYSRQAQDLRVAARQIVARLEGHLKQRLGAEFFRQLVTSLPDDWNDIVSVDLAPPSASGSPDAAR